MQAVPESATNEPGPGLAPTPHRAPPRSVVPAPPAEAAAGAAPSGPVVLEGGILEGDVRDAAGHLWAGAVVTALEGDEPLPPRRKGYMWYVGDAPSAAAKARQPSAVCDAAGHYEIRGIPLAKELTAAIHASDRLDGRSEPVTFSQPGEKQRRDVQLPPAGSLWVKFVGRSALASGTGQITVRGPTGWFDSFADDEQKDGAWLVDGLRPGSYTIQIFPTDSAVETRVVEVRAGERTLLEIAPPAGRSLDGIVVDARGAPIWKASVWWIGAGTIMGESDEAGRFHFNGILDEVGALRVESDLNFRTGKVSGLARADLEGVVPGRDPARVVLSPAPRLVARIVGLDPATSVKPWVLSKAVTGGDAPRRVGDGRFDVRLTVPDVPTMWVLKAAGFAPLVLDVVGPYPGGTRDLGDLRFDTGRTIAGTVRDESGGAVAGATVLVAEKWLDEEHETGTDGSFRFEHVPDRATEIRVNTPGYPVHIVTLPAGPTGEQPTITLSHGGTLSIRVLDERGAEVPEARVTFVPDGPHPYDVDYDKTSRSRETDADGRLTVHLQARGHRVSASEGRRTGRIESVVVKAGEATTIEIRIR